MTESHWNLFHHRWSRVAPPLRPNHEVVAAVKANIKPVAGGRTLLLGVTRELADIDSDVTGVDRHPGMVENLWPGNTDARRAMVGEWRKLEFENDYFSNCVGDGSLCVLPFSDVNAVWREIARVLRPGGIFACRFYQTPDAGETVQELRDAVLAGAIAGISAFKLRLMMAICAGQPIPNVKVVDILDAFCRMFPDRDELTRRTGWQREDIDTIDVYKESPEIYNMPRSAQILSQIPSSFSNPKFVAAGSYELAERCPILVVERAR